MENKNTHLSFPHFENVMKCRHTNNSENVNQSFHVRKDNSNKQNCIDRAVHDLWLPLAAA